MELVQLTIREKGEEKTNTTWSTVSIDRGTSVDANRNYLNATLSLIPDYTCCEPNDGIFMLLMNKQLLFILSMIFFSSLNSPIISWKYIKARNRFLN
jgi:hypothetical protein